MIVRCVTVYVKENHVKDFIDATSTNHKGSVAEDGNLRFDVLQCADDPCRFLLYEAYESIEATKVHKETTHYLIWKETVSDWFTQPRKGIAYNVICPMERNMW